MINKPKRTNDILFTCPRCGASQFNAFVLNGEGNIESEPCPPKWMFYNNDKGYLCPSCAKLWVRMVHQFFGDNSYETI